MKKELAINGGPKAKTTENYPMWPGGLEVGEEEKKLVEEVINSKFLFRYYGPKMVPTNAKVLKDDTEIPSMVKKFELEFAEKVGSKYSLAVNSCTSALNTALTACLVGPGDEVILPGYTFVASVMSIITSRAIPVIAEIDKTLTIDPLDIEKKINESTKALLIVHMRGVPCDMDKIMKIKEKYNLMVIEDVAQAVGGTYKGKYLGTFGDVGVYSFQYQKIITAGEGGMIVTDDRMIYERCKGYHDAAAFWRPDRYAEQRFEGELFAGQNYRMSELCGAVMRAQLKKLDELLMLMRRNQKRIISKINGIEGIEVRPVNDPDSDVCICLIFYLEQKDKVKDFVDALRGEGIDVGAVGGYNVGVPDWHIYAHWKQVLGKKTLTQEGCPWTCPYHKGKDIEYSEDMNPKTLEYLSRIVHLNIPPQMSLEDCDMIANGIIKVADALL